MQGSLPSKKDFTASAVTEDQDKFCETKTWNIKFCVKDFFQVVMLYCQSFTDEDIPDRLWQESEYGIT